MIAVLAGAENVLPPVPADAAVALGAFLAGRGTLNAWLVFALTWTANVASAGLVYAVARRYGRGVFRGILGRRLFSDATIAHIEREYERHGVYGIFLSRLLPVWRGVVIPFAGIAHVSAPRALIPVAVASALYYGVLIFLVSRLGTNLDQVLGVIGRVHYVLGLAALGALVVLAIWVVQRLKR